MTAQLTDGIAGDHVWAERYDRDLTDIFAIQDEISKAIVDALKVRLLPQEKKAIENRGTGNVDAYNLYLMARQLWIDGAYANARNIETIIRICEKAVALDPAYAQAWALMALAQAELRFWLGMDVDASPAAEHALSINPDLPEPRCVKARYFEHEGRIAEANEQIETALQTDAESWEVNREAARLMFRQARLREAAQFFEKASELMSSDFHSTAMLQTCYGSLGPSEMLRRTAERCRPIGGCAAQGSRERRCLGRWSYIASYSWRAGEGERLGPACTSARPRQPIHGLQFGLRLLRLYR